MVVQPLKYVNLGAKNNACISIAAPTPPKTVDGCRTLTVLTEPAISRAVYSAISVANHVKTNTPVPNILFAIAYSLISLMLLPAQSPTSRVTEKRHKL